MIAVALKGLAGRKIRALLTAFAIVIGVSMVAGTFILTDTTQQSGLELDDGSTATTDAAIFEKELVKGSTSGTHASMPVSMLAKVRALPGVADASGEVSPQKELHAADVIGRDGKVVATHSIARGVDPAKLNISATTAGAWGPLKLESGAWAKGPRQVVIDRHTAATRHYAIGDPIVISTLGTRHTFRIAGTVSFLAENLPPIPTLAVWDVKSAQKLLHREGHFDIMSIDAKPGTSGAQLVRAIQPLLPADLQVKGTEASVKEAEGDWKHDVSQIRTFLLVFGGIALLVGAFVIFNTLSITVAQRTRELATLRTLGASRKQVMRSVVIEGAVLGLVASAIGLVMGYGVAKGMMLLVDALGAELPTGHTVIATRTVLASMALGVGITLLASVLPARRATRVPPIAAVREGATLPPTRLAAQSHNAGGVVAAVSLATIAFAVFAGGLGATAVAVLLGGGTLGLFTGIALLAPRLVQPLARVVGWPARRIGGVAGEVAGANVVRNPGRTASTAATLMIGLTLVTVVAVLGAGLNSATREAVTDQVDADYIVDSKDTLPYQAAGGDKLAAAPGVTASSQVRSETVLVKGKESEITGPDPATITRFYSFNWKTGSDRTLGQLGADGAIVTKAYAEDNHLAIGGRIDVTTPAGKKGTLRVRGIYDPPVAEPLLGDISIGQEAFDSSFTTLKDSLTFLDADAGAAAAIRATAVGLGDASFHTEAGYADAKTKDRASAMAMLYALLGFSIIVSLFGMVNTMVLSVFERTREIGMLRTIGMTRRQARRMIRHESVITALIGATLGLGLGLFVAVLGTQAMPDIATMTIPWLALAGFSLVAVVAGVGAAVLPARRASRLKVLEAVSYE
ncbi:MAG TPA: FtsX-like permease family protein [Solirubrobacteraceae bacterium]